MHITATWQFYGFACFLMFVCWMSHEEGQNLSDFLLAMIPVKVPLNFETPPDKIERDVLSLICGILIGL